MNQEFALLILLLQGGCDSRCRNIVLITQSIVTQGAFVEALRQPRSAVGSFSHSISPCSPVTTILHGFSVAGF